MDSMAEELLGTPPVPEEKGATETVEAEVETEKGLVAPRVWELKVAILSRSRVVTINSLEIKV